MNSLYKDAISKFQDIRFWIAYIKFCKHVVSNKSNKFLHCCAVFTQYNISLLAFSQQH